MAPLAHRLSAVTVTEQRRDQAGQQKWEIIAQPMLATGIRDGFQQFAERRQMGSGQQSLPFFFSQRRKDTT
jgi:hypothetical protein